MTLVDDFWEAVEAVGKSIIKEALKDCVKQTKIDQKTVVKWITVGSAKAVFEEFKQFKELLKKPGATDALKDILLELLPGVSVRVKPFTIKDDRVTYYA